MERKVSLGQYGNYSEQEYEQNSRRESVQVQYYVSKMYFFMATSFIDMLSSKSSIKRSKFEINWI